MFHALWCLGAQRKGMVIMMEVLEAIRKRHSSDTDHMNFIFSDDQNIIVTAPAGCGKTTAMISKIARELSEQRIPNGKRILAMTFSVNAAIKIKDSLRDLLPLITENPEVFMKRVDVANYHNFAMKLLYKYGFYLDKHLVLLKEFVITNEESKEVRAQLTSTESEILSAFQMAVSNADSDRIRNLYNQYWTILKNKLFPKKIITYNGILVSGAQLLENEHISGFYVNFYRLIIIDEFQDTNYLALDLVRKIMGTNSVIFLGDEIQKIYGFLGAVDSIFDKVVSERQFREIEFRKNYRFENNPKLLQLDKFFRTYSTIYAKPEFEADIKFNCFKTEKEENKFIGDFINKICQKTNSRVAVLVRAGWQGLELAKELEMNDIPFFNALYRDTDVEYKNFYKITLEEFLSVTNGKRIVVSKDMQTCLRKVIQRQNEVYQDSKKKFIFDALLKLLTILFEQSRSWPGNTQERYDNILFVLNSNGLKHMMEYLAERVVLTTIHAAKGLEWDYVLIPKMHSCQFPTPRGMCNKCKQMNSNEARYTWCQFGFKEDLKKEFLEELSVLYVGTTRAKREVYFTANTGTNEWGYSKRTSCLINLPGLKKEQYSKDDIQ